MGEVEIQIHLIEVLVLLLEDAEFVTRSGRGPFGNVVHCEDARRADVVITVLQRTRAEQEVSWWRSFDWLVPSNGRRDRLALSLAAILDLHCFNPGSDIVDVMLDVCLDMVSETISCCNA